jgi:hypothetical protein
MKIGIVHPSEEAAKEYYKGFGLTKPTDERWTVNAGDSVNSYSDPANQCKKATWVGLSEQIMKQNEYMIAKASRTANLNPIKITRLTTYENWTILLRDNKLVAVNEKGETIEAIGSLLSAGGKAWMWKGGQLWSGVLERTLTEKQEQEAEITKKHSAIHMKYIKKFEALEDKQEALQRKRDEELRSL